MEQSENNSLDFETDIDTWVIDKEDSNGSISIDKSIGSEIKSMNKENIKHYTDASDKKSLRYFRIRKHVVYQELSSDSDSDSKRKHSSDKEDYTLWSKKIKSESSDISKGKTVPKSKPNHITPTSSLHNSTDNRRENVSLKSDEISMILSEMNENSEGNQERRERLHSIENVSNLSDSKEKVNDSPSSLKVPYTCYVCNLDYQSLEDFENHANIVHRKSSLSIPSQQIVESPLIQFNQDKQKPPNNLNSSINKSEFLDTFKTHLLKNGVIQHRRNISISNSALQMKPNIKTFKTGKLGFSCKICNFYTTKLLKFKAHEILFHSDIKDLNCEYCDFKTSICVNLATHIKVHVLDCSHCEYQCLGASELNKHMEKYHFTFKCSKCNFKCDSKGKFNRHMKMSHLIKEFKCEHCKSLFKFKPQLKAHIEKHCVMSKRFNCDDCEMGFSNKDDLRYHMRSHREFFVCDICKSKFAQKRYLMLHLKAHNNKNAFKCPKCDSVFPGKKNLRFHITRIHRSSDFKCEHCHFESTDTIDISKHICINKLYKVEKKELNFQKKKYESVSEINCSSTDESENHVNGNETSSELGLKMKIRKFSSETKKEPLNTLKCSERQEKVQRPRGETEIKAKTHDSKSEKVISLTKKIKIKKNKFKSRCLRQNLPSRTNQKSVYKTEKVIGTLQNSTNKCCKTKGVVSKKIRNKNTVHMIRGKGAQNSLLVKSSQYVTVTKTNCSIKQMSKRKQYVLKDLDCMQMCFGKQNSISKLLIDPVRFVDGGFVQCYYQSQPTAAAPLEHVERHLRQRSLLSCRLCRYKTNSQQLLQRHTAETHTWDPAVINALFS